MAEPTKPDGAAAAPRTILGHPVGLAYIVFTETWERFSFFGMQALLVLYMATHLFRQESLDHVLGLSAFRTGLESFFGELSTQALATQVFGLYIGLIYLMPVFGGLLGDRVLGRTRAVLLGASLMAGGHFLMAFEAWFLVALILLILGSGLLKGNLAAQVGSLYEKNDRRREPAFTIYNVGISIGATIAPLVCGTLGELFGWHWGFGAAGVGMIVGIGIYIAGLPHMPAETVGAGQAERPRLEAGDGRIIGALLVLFLIATLFWSAQAQVWNSYPLWISERVDRAVLGATIPVTWFQSVDAIAVVALAPLVLWFWRRQADRNAEPEDFRKITIGFAVHLGAFVWLAMGDFKASAGQVGIIWPLTFHFILAAGFLYVGPVMMALVSRVAPAAVNAMMVGSYYISIFFGGLVSGWLGRFYERLAPGEFWLLHAGVVFLGLALILMLRGPLARATELATTAKTV